MSYIYKITNKINNKCYIGKTDIHTVEERFKEHIKDSYKYTDRPLYRAMNKYGRENFTIEQLEECSELESSERERYWIEYYGSFHYGYNATLGGDGRAYIDYDLVVKTYLQVQNQTKTAELLNISQDSVALILKSKGIKALSSSEVSKKQLGHSVLMIDKDTKKEIKSFLDQSDAAKWIISQKKTTMTDTTKISYVIGRAARGLRKTAYGYEWRLL